MLSEIGAWRRGALTAVAIAALVVAAGPAAAEEPFRLAQQIEDRVGALDGREAEVLDAMERLQESDGIQLWVAYVDSFSGLNAQDWADRTATISSLGLNDVLLAVATDDRAYAYSVDQQFPLSDVELAEVATVAIEPALSNNDWAGAAIGAAQGIGRSLSGQPVTGPEIQPGQPSPGGAGLAWVPLVLLGVLLVGVIGFVLVRRARTRPAGPAPASQDPYERLSTADLRRRAAAQLVETDDAIKTSEQELGFAIAEFGEEQTAPFSAALEAAHEDMAVAFRLQQQLDDAEPEDEATRRSMLIEMCRRTDAASDRLDAEAEKFDELRDLQKNVPQVLARLERSLDPLARRIPSAAATVRDLGGTYAPQAMAAVADNVDQATNRLELAREQVAAGQRHLGAGTPGRAVVPARAAEEATGQAARLLDAIDRLKDDLAESGRRIEAAIVDTERSLAEATRSGAGEGLDEEIAAAEAALEEARSAASPQGGRDPLGALRRLEEADEALDRALEGVRDARQREEKARTSLQQALPAARAQVDAARDFITTRRGAVRAEARTRLSEAERHLERATSLGDTEPVTALQEAKAAESLARQAQRLADEDVSRYRHREPAVHHGGTDWGAMLGGILIGTVLGGGRHGRGGGGLPLPGGGGRRGGGGRFGFGGRGMGGRRGGGGRF